MSITTITRVSTDSNGGQRYTGSSAPSISADGRFVAFESSSIGVLPNDSNVFVKDLQTGAHTLVSSDAGGAQGNSRSFAPSISADGRFVAFDGYASNLVPDDTDGWEDVFVKDLQTGAVTRVSTDATGGQANAWSGGQSISADGRYVAFSSVATNLLPGDTNRLSDLFVKDLQTGAVTRISTDAAGGQSNGFSESPSISADGRFVAFESVAWNLIPGDTKDDWDVFVKDLQTGAVTRVSTDAAGGQGDSGSYSPSISADGRFVAFSSYASNLVPGDTNRAYDVFVKDLQTGAIARLSTDVAGGQGNRDSSEPSISDDGRFVAFSSLASNLVPGDTYGSRDVFATPNPLFGAMPPATLTADDDTWTGNGSYEVVYGLAGDDSLAGGVGIDSLIGGDGDDTLDGGTGPDILAGGSGADTYYVDVAGDVITGEVGSDGVNRVYSKVSWTLGSDLHHLYLKGKAPVDATGNANNNVLGGNGNENHLSGLGGPDRLWGLRGNDTLDGGTGKDSLFGGAGSDRLVGGSGADLFSFTGAELTDATADVDVIADYSRAQGDSVDLPSPTGFTVLSAPGATLRIQLAGSLDIVEFTGITSAADVLFV